MASVGRFVCVLMPFLLTLASLIALLIAGLAGVADKSLYMFQVNTTDLSISPLSVDNILSNAGINLRSSEEGALGSAIESRQAPKVNNITAADLNLHKLYDVHLWGYCYIPQNGGGRQCTKPAFNWATNVLNTTTGDIESLLTVTGQNVALPKEIKDAVRVFGTVSRWTQIVFVIAYVALGVELLLGIFANCSRIFSCVTWLVAMVATSAVCASAALSTATAVVVVGAVEGTAKFYGVDASFNTRFLVAVWLAAAFALAAGLFWLFTICCCKPDHSSRRGKDSEKFLPSSNGSYQRLSGPQGGYPAPAGYHAGYPQPYASPQHHAGAYEPYSHARV